MNRNPNPSINYQKWLDQTLEQLQEENKDLPVKRLLLHSCCAPCSSYVLEYLSKTFAITVFYFNPNISPLQEYQNRLEEQKRLLSEMKTVYPISFLAGEYKPELFYQTVKGLEQEREGQERCFRCYQLRITETARLAKEKKFDYFTTTLSISPLKNAKKLNEIGKTAAEQYDIPYLYSDFKKKGGYQRSIELSKEFQLYRQDYCGCFFSKREREERRQ